MCSNSTLKTENDVQMLIDYIADSLGTMAMVNYPYPTSFIRPLPGWPVNASCVEFNNVTASDAEVTDFNFRSIKGLARMMKLWQGDDCIYFGS